MKNKTKKYLFILFCFAVLVIILLAIFNSVEDEELEVLTEEQRIELINEKLETKTLNKLAGMGEMDRMQFYLTQFINYIENKDYEDAYELLNVDFRKNYFENYSDFEEYAKSKFSTNMSVSYDNFERNGEIYVFWITLTNPIVATKDEGVEMNFVIKENDLNDFEMSFSVI